MHCDIQRVYLDGIEVVTCRAPGVPKPEAKVVFRAGSNEDVKWGTAHFLEHTMYLGSQNYPNKAETYAYQANATLHAATSFGNTEFDLKIAHDNWRLGIDLLADAIQNPLFDENAIAKEARVICREIQDKPFRVPMLPIIVGLQQHLYGENLRSGLGTEESVLSITPDDLRGFCERYYVRENCMVFMMGDLSHAAMQNHIATAFSAMRHGEVVRREPFSFRAGYDLLPLPYHNDVMQCITMPMPAGELTSQNAMILSILGGAFGDLNGNIMIDMREKRQMVYSLSFNQDVCDAFGYAHIGYVSSPEESEGHTAAMLTHMYDIADGKFDEQFFDYGKAWLVDADTAFFANQAFPRVSDLWHWRNFGDEMLTPDSIISAIRSVTFDDFLAVAGDIFRGPKGLYAYGNTKGVISEPAFRSAIAPLASGKRSALPTNTL